MLQKKYWSQKIQIVMMLVLGAVSGGCAVFENPTVLPTLIPEAYLPTAIALTASALETGTPTKETASSKATTAVPVESDLATPTTIETAETQVPDPTITATAGSGGSGTLDPKPEVEIPFADIQILRPGELSKVVSPIPLHAFLIPGANNRAQVALYGEDGRLIYRQIFRFGDSGVQTHLRTDIKFEISGVAETARLVLQTQDERGRILSLVSEDLILLAMGASDINPASDLLETLAIENPSPRELIQGGTATITGWARVEPGQLLLVELIANDGRVLGSRLAGTTSWGDGEHGLFGVEVPYQVGAPTWARITVTERGIRLPGPITVSSVEVLLSP
ncbi:MAG: hypothetical protein ABFS03_01895 [Chloroflexota bacterium]